MTTRWQDVRCASIRVEDLPVLADLRRETGIRVTISQGRAWICWDDETGDATQNILVARLLPLPGVETFTKRDGCWYRMGESLPAFHVPLGDASVGDTLDRVILPERLTFARPDGDAPRPVPLSLVRDPGGQPRPASAVRCPFVRLAEWAEKAPSPWIESLSGAWCEPASGGDDAEVLVIGPAERLPAVIGAARFWGTDVLIPLGYRAEPQLADRALRSVIGAVADDFVVLECHGLELISREAFRPLSRAGIRLAVIELSRGLTSKEARQ